MNRALTAILVFFLMLPLSLAATQAEGRTIVDMDGRTVRVPKKITSVFGASPPITSIIYAMDPSLLVGWNAPKRAREDREYLPGSARSLPVIGGWYGQGQSANMEVLIKINPDLVLMSGWRNFNATDRAEKALKRLHKPVVHIRTIEMPRYAETFRFLGRLFNLEERGQRLAEYAERSLAEISRAVDGVPENKKVRVYYAEGIDGLFTECDQSMHTELIRYAGGKNVLQCAQKTEYGMRKTNLEQVLAWNPDVILVQERAFYQRVYKDPRWHNIKAVRNRKVHLIPKAPFNWFDRPPSYMRLVGLKWVANILYPERARLDMLNETREFYRLFLHVELPDTAIRKILNNQ